MYTAASGYRWLLRTARDWNSSQNWEWVWKLPAPAKVQYLIWLILHRALPTNAFRHQRGLLTSHNCQRCSSNVEDIIHCLRDCPHARELWIRLGLVQHPWFLSVVILLAGLRNSFPAMSRPSFSQGFGGRGNGVIT